MIRYFIYRITFNGKGFAFVDSSALPCPQHVGSYIEDYYLPDSTDGEVYVVINAQTGEVAQRYTVKVETKKVLV